MDGGFESSPRQHGDTSYPTPHCVTVGVRVRVHPAVTQPFHRRSRQNLPFVSQRYVYFVRSLLIANCYCRLPDTIKPGLDFALAFLSERFPLTGWP